MRDAQYVFSDFSTINGELYGCLFGYPSSANVPCVFQTPQPSPPPAQDGSDVSKAELAFRNGDLNLAEEILKTTLKKNSSNELAGYVMRVVEREKKLRDKSSNVEHATPRQGE